MYFVLFNLNRFFFFIIPKSVNTANFTFPDKKDSGDGFKEVTSRPSGRSGARQSQGSDRQGPRRREGAQSDRVPRSREPQSRPRSPK